MDKRVEVMHGPDGSDLGTIIESRAEPSYCVKSTIEIEIIAPANADFQKAVALGLAKHVQTLLAGGVGPTGTETFKSGPYDNVSGTLKWRGEAHAVEEIEIKPVAVPPHRDPRLPHPLAGVGLERHCGLKA